MKHADLVDRTRAVLLAVCCLAFWLATPSALHAQLSPADAARDMMRGINLGNTLEPPLEGGWNNDPAREELFDSYVDAGFNTVRIPVRWDMHTDLLPPFSVDAEWMDRVEEVVEWGLERDLFVIINAHHDDWIKQHYADPTMRARFDSIWSQVAVRFKDGPDKLIFEIINEPLGLTRVEIDELNARILGIIRKTNPTRIVVYSGNEWASSAQLLAAAIPNDPFVMGYYHSYDPWEFAGLGDGTWGTAEQRSVLEGQIEQVAAWSAQNNVPVMVSEFGAIHDTDFNSRMRYYSVYVSSLIENEMPHQVWDDGGMFEVLKRDVLTWHETKEILLHTWPDGPDWFDISTPGDSLIVLSWQNRALHDHIEVQRKTGEEAFSTVAVLPATATSWSDTTGQKGTTYDYRIIARNAIEGDRHSHPLRAHLRAIPLSEFYHTEGTRIVPAEGAPEMARGIGLGGWLVPEGYMLHTPGHWGPTQISNAIEALIGAEDTQTFWEMYRSHYVAEADVELIARWGFDHIRVPMHWKLLYDMDADIFIESGFDLLDNFLDWCGKNGIYVVLDLHAAPGAQSDGPIADSDGTARLWTEPVPYQDATVKLWQEIARRYVFDTRIIGYDLLNEPVTPDEIEEPAVVLRALYKRITKAIREVDKNHILFIEGNYFATTFDNLAPPFDDNMVYSFHKYWNSPDLGTIGYLLNLRESTNVPLWLGETGENSNTWFHETVKLMEDNDIGWNIWTHKKLRTTTSPLSTPMSEGYASILDYWKDEGAEPTREEAREALFEQARLLHVDSARTNPGVIPSLLDPDFGLFRVPFTQHDIPGFVNAADYDIGKTFVTHSDKDYWAINGSPGGGNSGGHYRNDGVDIEPSTDSLGHAYNVGWLEPLEWMEYTVDVQESGLYTMTVRVSAINAGGAMTFYMDGARIGTISVPQTGGWQAWHSVQVEGIQLEAGRQVLRATVGRTGGFNVNRFTFDLVSTTKTDSTLPSSEPSFDLYPIPAKGIVSFAIRVPLHSQVKIRLYDLLGRLVGEKTADVGVGNSDVHMPLAGLASGQYLVRVTLDTGRSTTVLTKSLALID